MQDFPVLIIPTFNNPTYLHLMTEQLSKLKWNNYLIVDSGSTYPEMKDLLRSFPDSKKMLLKENVGPRYFSENVDFYDLLPQFFCVTDPDLMFNPKLPSNFIEQMREISNAFEIGKVGFALDISKDVAIREDFYILESKLQTIREYESKYWKKQIKNSRGLEIYKAPIDTTFALYNKKYFKPEKSFTMAIRVAGNFSAIHLPWLINELRPAEEVEFYKKLNLSGAFHEIDGMHLKLLQEIDDLKQSFSWRITKPLRASTKLKKLLKNI